MPKTRPPYAPEFCRQMTELVRAGRDPTDLAREFEPSSQAIRSWVAQADREDGRRKAKPLASEAAPGNPNLDNAEFCDVKPDRIVTGCRNRHFITSHEWFWSASPNNNCAQTSSGEREDEDAGVTVECD